LNDRTFDDVNTSLLLTGKLTYILSPTSLLEGSVSYFSSKLDREDSYLGNNWQQWWDSTAVANATNGEVQFMDRFTPEPNYLFNGFYFARRGAPYRTYRIQKQNYISGALSWNSQIGRHHEVKIGGDYRRYTLRRFVVRPDVVKIKFDPDKPLNADNVALVQYVTNSRVNNYGYDIFGNEADADAFDQATGVQTAEAPKHPAFGSFYIQDKIEYNDLIINAGLRLDYFDTKSKRLVNPENPAIDQNTKKFLDEAWQEVDPYTQISPRLGFSFPVSEKTVFYMQYGKFVQMPELETMFAGIHEYNFEYIGSGFAFLDPAGFGLEPVRTTSYEIGFRQQLGQV
ncbi:MAG: TonB-dependent receptor, partial [Methanobacteriota archaeon]